mmetsp:Transcript_127231/g.360105  ORF Transcript_127231/g.360105 Transcript_127231/m.360105 type:complete len:227 (+) Transcript_127231:72-752(+)
MGPGAPFFVAAGALLCATFERCHAAVSKEAVASIRCDVCGIAVQEARAYAQENTISDEDGLSDLVEGLCSVKKKEGRWVAKYDISREDDEAPLTLTRQGLGECRNECLTMQRACAAALKGQEEAMVELLMAGKGQNEMKKKLCKKQCAKAPPRLKEWTDEVFVPRDEKEVETEDMIEKMRAETGMGMKMYKRDEMLSMSEGDMETMAAKEAYASERQASRFAEKEL